MRERETMRQGEEEKREEPRVKVDELWKRAVAEEKARLRTEEQAQETRRAAEAPRRGPLPEPTMEVFIAGLYTQTLMALGEIPNPLTGRKEADIEEAAHLIDIIAMLQSKTQGNLTVEESSYMRNALTDLRMRYVRASEAPPATENKRPPTGQA